MPVRHRTSTPVTLPQVFADALKADPKAAAVFETFPPSHRREYAKWIREARTEPTRERRVAQALTRIAAAKPSA